MKKKLLAGVSLILALTPIAFAGPTVYTDPGEFDAVTQIRVIEDFESVVPKNTALPSFTSQGITYIGLAGSPISNVYVAAPGFTNFGVPITTSSVLTANGDEDFSISIKLDRPATALAFDTYLNGFGPATIRVFGAKGLLGTYSISHDADEIGFYGVTSLDPITAIQWTTVNGRQINTGIDNVKVGNVVPAPGALLLGAVGTGLVGCLRRRKAV